MAKHCIRFSAPFVGEGLVPLLCNEAGEALPNQRKVTIEAAANDVVTATVQFDLGKDLPIVVD